MNRGQASLRPYLLIVNPFDTLPGENFRPQRYTVLYELLKETDVRVTWITSDFRHWSHSRRLAEGIPAVDKKNISLVRTLSYTKNIGVRRLISYLLLSLGTLCHLLRLPERPDLILCVGPVEEIFIVSLYARLKRIPLVLDVLDLWPDVYVEVCPEWAKGFARLLLSPYLLIARAAYRQATHVTAVSATYAQWAMKLNRRTDANNFSFYYLGAPANRFRLNAAAGPLASISCLFAGQFGFSYDLELIVRAAHHLYKYGRTNIQFVLCGDGTHRKRLIKLARGLPNIQFAGWVTPDTLNEIGMKSHIGLCTYRRRATQSVPNKVFDYMAMGLFTISSLRGETADLLAKYGVGDTYVAENLESFLSCLLRFADEQSFTTGYKEGVRRVFETYYDSAVIYKRMINETLLPLIDADRRPS
jgi:glycosyltransferase involved in cell wall biosynthesis